MASESGRKSNRTKWLRPRHQVLTSIFAPCLRMYSILKCGVEIERFEEDGQYLILFNHQTGYDQFFVAGSFRRPTYFVASEDLFSNGFVSRLLSWAIAPVAIKKGQLDISSIRNCLQIAHEGGSIAIAPEGNKTYSGRTEYMNPSIANFAKKLKLPVLLYRIEGGYGVLPRWSDVIRKGKMKAYVSEVISADEVSELDSQTLFERIRSGLYAAENNAKERFLSDKKAEFLERVAYVCPDCGFSAFESSGNEIKCTSCGKRIRYSDNTSLVGVDCDFPFGFVAEWYDYQQDFVNRTNLNEYCSAPVFEDVSDIYEVILLKKKNRIARSAKVRLYGNRVVLGEDCGTELLFDDISGAAVLGRNKLNLYHKDRVYQFKGNKRFNALKYVNFYYRYKNIKEGRSDDKFLGL